MPIIYFASELVSVSGCWTGLDIINSLLPVSRYIDTAFADKGSHQKKNLQPKCPDTSKFGLLGKPTKKLELNPLFQSIFETSKFQKLKKSCFFLF